MSLTMLYKALDIYDMNRLKGYKELTNPHLTIEIDYTDYKLIKIDTFKELLGMREELQSPILMYTDPKEDRRTTFRGESRKTLLLDEESYRYNKTENIYSGKCEGVGEFGRC